MVSWGNSRWARRTFSTYSSSWLANMRQLSKSSRRMGEWSLKPISVSPAATARAAYSTGSPAAWRQSGVCIW